MSLAGGTVQNSLTGGIVAAAAILAVGCGSHTSSSASQPANRASALPASAAASTSASAAASPAAATPTAAAASAPACATSNLRITLGNGGAGAGTDFTVLDFINSGTTTCTLYGFPGVSLTNAADVQIGAAAIRDPASNPPALVTLAPGAEANTEIGIGNAENYSAADCKPTPATQLKIYPPNQTQAIQVHFTTTACALKSAPQLSVNAVAAGPGQTVP
jgi:Domain of unknown function (DUF4232)